MFLCKTDRFVGDKETADSFVCFLLGNSSAPNFRRWGITQKKAYNIQKRAKV
jgi:hypothetical protein